MSTHSIAQENAETLVTIHVSLQGSEPRSGQTAEGSLDNNALDLSARVPAPGCFLASSGGEAEVGNRKGRPNTCSNLAVNFVQSTLPGPCNMAAV